MLLESMNLNLSQLWYFVNIAECGSFSAAARYLNVSQSALSKSMQSLEKSLETVLFDRNGKTLALTRAGAYLYPRWKTLLTELEDQLLQARKKPGGGGRALRIGTLDSHRSEAFLLDAVNRFRAANPDCEVTIERVATDILKKKLLEQELDVAFTVLYEAEYGHWPDCEVRLIRACPHLACMLPSSPLAGSAGVSQRELEQMNLVVISSLYLPTYTRMLEALFDRLGTQPRVIFSTANASSQVYHLHRPEDFFICDQYHRDYALNGLVYLPVANTRSGVVMVWNRAARGKELDAFLSLFPCDNA